MTLLHWIHVLISGFLAILFLQSGIDKVADWRGNLEWLTDHFKASPLAGVVAPMLATIAVIEIAAGTASALAIPAIVFAGELRVAIAGTALSSVALLMLFLGQRLAKDYDGAAVLVNYFLLTIVGLYLLYVAAP